MIILIYESHYSFEVLCSQTLIEQMWNNLYSKAIQTIKKQFNS